MNLVHAILVPLLLAGCALPTVSRPTWMESPSPEPFASVALPSGRCGPDEQPGRDLRRLSQPPESSTARANAICRSGNEYPSRSAEQVRIDAVVVEARTAGTSRR